MTKPGFLPAFLRIRDYAARRMSSGRGPASRRSGCSTRRAAGLLTSPNNPSNPSSPIHPAENRAGTLGARVPRSFAIATSAALVASLPSLLSRVESAFRLDEGDTAEWLTSECRAGAVTAELFPSELLEGLCARNGPNPIRAAHASTQRKWRSLEFITETRLYFGCRIVARDSLALSPICGCETKGSPSTSILRFRPTQQN